MGTVAKYCDRAIILDKGEKLAEGEPTEMIDLYKKVLVNQNKATVKKKRLKIVIAIKMKIQRIYGKIKSLPILK